MSPVTVLLTLYVSTRALIHCVEIRAVNYLVTAMNDDKGVSLECRVYDANEKTKFDVSWTHKKSPRRSESWKVVSKQDLRFKQIINVPSKSKNYHEVILCIHELTDDETGLYNCEITPVNFTRRRCDQMHLIIPRAKPYVWYLAWYKHDPHCRPDIPGYDAVVQCFGVSIKRPGLVAWTIGKAVKTPLATSPTFQISNEVYNDYAIKSTLKVVEGALKDDKIHCKNPEDVSTKFKFLIGFLVVVLVVVAAAVGFFLYTRYLRDSDYDY